MSNSSDHNLEYVKCLERNNNNQFIKSINIISEDETIEQLINFDKVNFIKVNKRPTFRSIIDYINYNIKFINGNFVAIEKDYTMNNWK
jgi:hypothetical protein